jgi:transposase InsO family protein
VKFAFIHDHLEEYPVTLCCRVLRVSRSGYYAWCKRPASIRQHRRETLAEQIGQVHQANRGVYGSPRVHQVLQAAGEQVCENTVAKIMREQCLRAKGNRRFVPRTTDSAHGKPVAANVLDRQFAADAPNRRWVADITYIPTREDWLYLAGVLDLYSRKIVGWSMADHLGWELVADALDMGLWRRQPPKGLLHHSDRGVQYACDNYQGLLARHGITVSMSGVGNCYDNAAMESFWATLKTELVHHEQYATRDDARRSIFEYIEAFYNRKRIHSSLGYVSPEVFEAATN